MPKLQIPRKLEPFFNTKKRFKVAFGGRGGAKSQTISDIALMKCQTEGLKFGCFREFQNSIEDSVFSLMIAEINRIGIIGYRHTDKTIDNESGGKFRFKGLARNIESIKSMFGFNVFWVEEAQTISKDSLKLLTPTIRTHESEVWFSLNAMSAMDPISVRFLEPYYDQLLETGVYEDRLHYITWINYTDNPWFPQSLEDERLHDYEEMPRALYNHVWLGHYNDSVENAIITADMFEAAIDAHKKLGFKPEGVKVVSHDPSDTGPDDKALTVRHGSVILDVDTLATGDSNEGMDWALSRAIQEQADLFAWDCDGLGSSLSQQVRNSLKGKKIDFQMFKGSEKVDRPMEVYDDPAKHKTDDKKQKTNKQTFRNKRAQYYWSFLRDRFYNTYRAVKHNQWIDPDKMISISSDIEKLAKLKSEVCRIPRKYNSNGFIQIMNKDEMRRMKITSPNMSDSLMMSGVAPKIEVSMEDMEFASLW